MCTYLYKKNPAGFQILLFQNAYTKRKQLIYFYQNVCQMQGAINKYMILLYSMQVKQQNYKPLS